MSRLSSPPDLAAGDCRDFTRRLEPFLLSELPAGSMRAVQLHLRGCRDCRARLREMRARVDVVVPANLVAFAHGQLPDAQRRLVAAHLDYCEACHEEYLSLQETVNELVKTFSQYQLGADFRQRVMQEWRPHRAGRRSRVARPGLVEMIELAETGNRFSYERLVDAYCHYVYACAYGAVRDFQLAARLAHELFVQGMSSFDADLTHARFRGWLRERVRELAAADDWYRDYLGEGMEAENGEGLSGFSRSRKLVRHRRLLAFAADLPGRERLPFLLFYVERRDYSDIGRTLELSRGEVTVVLARATRAARDRLRAPMGGGDHPAACRG